MAVHNEGFLVLDVVHDELFDAESPVRCLRRLADRGRRAPRPVNLRDQNTIPVSSRARDCEVSSPLGPNTRPGVVLDVPTYESSKRTKNALR